MKVAAQIPPRRIALRRISLFICAVWLLPATLHAQTQTSDVTCDSGSGQYSTEFNGGVSVEVGPIRNGAFAERACEAKLVSKGQDVVVADNADQVGIDVLGVDLGFGKPVVAFQIDQTGRGSDVEYKIYSLSKPTRLLYTLSGGDSYSAADSDLDGRVEVWTDDAAAVDGFDGIPKSALDIVPTVVLRFEKGRPVDVGSEFIPYYDARIAQLRSAIANSDLAAFKQSDGRLSVTGTYSGSVLHALMRTKIAVLEIVWAYLYSGRDKEAWAALDEMWPANDLARIRAALVDLRSRGLLHKLDQPRRRPYRRGRAKTYDAVATSPVVTTVNPYGGAPDSSQSEPPIVQPKSILLRRPPAGQGGSLPSQDETVELVVDAAGKVRSAKIIKGSDEPLIQATSGWHFIPAFRDGLPVACRFRLSVWLLK